MVTRKNIVEADDGGFANEVGVWALEKHRRLTNYVGITSAVRRKWLKGSSGSATYIDLYCAMGRSKIKTTGEFVDGSSVAAWKESQVKNAPFSQVFIADADEEAVEQCTARLVAAGAPVVSSVGKAEDTVNEICDALDPRGYHFAFVDPYNLETLPFQIIERLCAVSRMDLLIHVSALDLQRNFGEFLSGKQKGLDSFAPGWRDVVEDHAKPLESRQKVFAYWRKKISEVGKLTAPGIELVSGSKNQPLYWLVLASGHPLAEKFWDEIRNVNPQQSLF